MGDAIHIWPRQRSTAVWLIVLVSLQTILFFAATRPSFFTHEDFYNFALAGDRSFVKYLLTPIIHVYPAPGDRLLFWLLHHYWPVNYVAARSILLAMLAGTTVLLGALVRALARSEQSWTVALLTPFALSLTLVSPVNLWSNGVPVMPALFCTVVALAAWLQSYTNRNATWWVIVTVAAVAAASAFYLKFMLIPLYLLFLRVAIFPVTMKLPVSVRALWQERGRWIALAVPVVLFLGAYIGSGLAGRSYVPGDRPYAAYFAAAWFGAVVPVSVLNVALSESPKSGAAWLVIGASQLLFWGIVGITCRRSALASRAWALFVLVFIVNTAMVGAVRLPSFGVELAYWLRYYPEVILFFPIALALCLRQGDERGPGLGWENTRAGRVALVSFAAMQILVFAVVAPRIVGKAEGVRARAWIDNLRTEIDALRRNHPGAVRIVDTETPEYVVLSWMAPYNRVSTILTLMHIDAVYNDVSGPASIVQADGRLAPAVFRPITRLRPAAPDSGRAGQDAWCLHTGAPFEYRPVTPIAGERLALRVSYGEKSRQLATVQVDTGDPDRRYRDLELRPFQTAAELIDLATARVQSLRIEPSPGDSVCIASMDLGVLLP